MFAIHFFLKIHDAKDLIYRLSMLYPFKLYELLNMASNSEALLLLRTGLFDATCINIDQRSLPLPLAFPECGIFNGTKIFIYKQSSD